MLKEDMMHVASRYNIIVTLIIPNIYNTASRVCKLLASSP